jgi:hypothetical protein
MNQHAEETGPRRIRSGRAGKLEMAPSKREGATKKKINSEEKWNERDEERQYKGH